MAKYRTRKRGPKHVHELSVPKAQATVVENEDMPNASTHVRERCNRRSSPMMAGARR